MNHHLSFILTKHPNKSWGILGGQGEKFTNPQPTNRSKPTQTCWKHDLTYRDAWNLFVLYFLGWKKKLQKPDKKNPIKTAGAPFGFQVGMVHSKKKTRGEHREHLPQMFLGFRFSLPSRLLFSIKKVTSQNHLDVIYVSLYSRTFTIGILKMNQK